jgi:intraflagellar transport protein 20
LGHVESLTEILQQQSTKIETNKMLAIGQRNRIETETETRRRKQAELQYLIAQKHAELQRIADYRQTLNKAANDQQAMIDRLQSS